MEDGDINYEILVFFGKAQLDGVYLVLVEVDFLNAKVTFLTFQGLVDALEHVFKVYVFIVHWYQVDVDVGRA